MANPNGAPAPPEDRRCVALGLKTGKRCKSWTLPDADRCSRHARTVGKVPSLPRRVCTATKNDGTPCPTWAKRDDDLCTIHARMRDGQYVGNPNRKYLTEAEAKRAAYFQTQRARLNGTRARIDARRRDREREQADAAFGAIRNSVDEIVPYLETLTDDDRARLRARQWALDGACRGKDNATWFPERGEHHVTATARVVCVGCPVRTDCLAYALIANEKYGTWGGASENQRRQLRAQLRAREIDIDEEAPEPEEDQVA